MLNERTYMYSTRGIFKRSICDSLIIILIVSFVFQSIVDLIFDHNFIYQLLSFNPPSIRSGYFWSLITYGFLHDGPLHLIMNLLGLHFISRHVEQRIGSKSFKIFITICLISGSLIWLLFNFGTNSHLIGFSAVILGSLCFFCLERPNQPITLLLFFVLPVTIKPKWLLLGVIGLEIYGLLNTELTGFGGIAHSAHFGGICSGFIFYIFFTKNISLPVKFTFTPRGSQKTNKKTNSLNRKPNYKVNFSMSSSIKKETDRILDKINEKGFGSLTSSEKETLEKAKKLLDS
jgi:membrane associated rhomboid family serine protease